MNAFQIEGRYPESPTKSPAKAVAPWHRTMTAGHFREGKTFQPSLKAK
jgi:hypothetical protein